MNASIETALEEGILSTRKEQKIREYFMASSLGFCPRKQVAERLAMAPTNPPDRRSQFKMWTGTVLGKAIQDSLEKQGYLDPAWHEKRLEYKNYVGKVDGYTAAIEGGAIVEIKTSDDDSITKYKEMPEHYLWQGFWYCVASGVPNLLIFQVGKNQGIVRNRLFVLDDLWRKRIEGGMEAMRLWWKEWERTGQLPEHMHQFGFEDRFCPYIEDELTQMNKNAS